MNVERADNLISSLGLEAYRVGGSVRDQLMGRRIKDADYMIRNATSYQIRTAVKANLPEAKITALKLRDGRQVGVRVAAKGYGLLEIALPRTEVSTGPGRQDFEIVTNPKLNLAEDACRRDFTFNALYASLSGTIFDPTGRGLWDLQHKMINTTHPDSFRDDPLRILRALRFVSTLGFELGSYTRAEMENHADAVTGLTQKGVSGTALDELCKLLMGPNVAGALRDASDTGVLSVLLPELADMLGFEQGSKYHDLTTDEHTFKALETAAHVDAPLRVRMGLLFHDCGKPASAWVGKDGRTHYYQSKDSRTEDHEVVSDRLWRDAAKRLNAPRDLRNDVSTLILNHMVVVHGSIKATKVRRARVKLGDDLLRDLYLMRMCDISGKGPGKVNRAQIENVGKLERVRQDAQDAGVPATVKNLPVDGHDMKALGLIGRDIGRVLGTLLDEVACQPNLNDRDWLINRAKELI